MRNSKFSILNSTLLTDNTKYILILLIIVLGFALRVYDLGWESLWYDELLQLDIAQGSTASIFAKMQKHTALPLDYLISHFWILLGREDFWVRVPAALLGTLTLPLAYQFGKLLLGPGAGLLFLALLALSPFHFYYSQEARPYALLVLGIILAGYAYWKFRLTGRWRYVLALQLGVLLFGLAHFFSLAIFVPLLAFAVLDLISNRNRIRAIQALAALVLSGGIVFSIILSLGYGQAIFYSSKGFGEAVVEPERFTLDASQKPNKSTGPQVDWTFITESIIEPLGTRASDTAVWLFNGLAGGGLIYLLAQKKYKLALLFVLWFTLPIVTIVAFLAQRGTFFATRYIIIVLPAYLMLVAAGLLALLHWPGWGKARRRWIPLGAFMIVSGFVFLNLAGDLGQLYRQKDKEDWRLVSQILAQNASPDDAIIATNAEATTNWYGPAAIVETDYYDRLDNIQAAASQAKRSWVIVSVFTDYLGDAGKIKAWLGEQNAIDLELDPVITVYYLGSDTDSSQLLQEIQGFALPVDPVLYASLARENRRNPTVARQYYQLAIEHASDDQMRAEYQSALSALP